MRDSDFNFDKARGAVWGQAIGDAVGLSGEFLSKSAIKDHYGEIRGFGQWPDDAHRARWQPGEWTDDTDHLLILLKSFHEMGEIDLLDIASRLYKWACNGGRGIGENTMTMFLQSDFLSNPLAASKRVWERSGRRSAANGALMRSAAVGLIQTHDAVEVADLVASITHYDKRCRYSSAVMASLINNLIADRNVDPIQSAVNLAGEYELEEQDLCEYIHVALDPDISALNLDGRMTPENRAIGYTLKTLSAGLWALENCDSYEDGVLAVINEGGDADTNGAVAGALLGAKFGYRAIPERLTKGIIHHAVLDSACDSLTNRSHVLCFDRSRYLTKAEEISGTPIPEPEHRRDDIPSTSKDSGIQIEVHSLSRLSNTRLAEGAAVISICSPGTLPFCDFPERTLFLRFSDSENPFEQGRFIDRAVMKLGCGRLEEIAERYWTKRSSIKFAVVPFRATQVRMIQNFVSSLPLDCKTLYIHCEFGQSCSAAIAECLHDLYGFSVSFKEANITPNPFVKTVFREA